VAARLVAWIMERLWCRKKHKIYLSAIDRAKELCLTSIRILTMGNVDEALLFKQKWTSWSVILSRIPFS